jgi:predicted HicB family RNase H-like nuclease
MSSSADDPRVNFGARIRASVRKRARLYAVENDIDLQTVIDQAIDEYLRSRGA